jgi:PAS domain S-box-containing protein
MIILASLHASSHPGAGTTIQCPHEPSQRRLATSSMLATMPDIIDKAQWLLKPQLKPALALDASGTVIAINPGSLRLIYTSPIAVNHDTPDPVIGSKISDLGIIIAPSSSPALCTWDDILVTVATKTNENEPEKAFTSNSNISQATDHFWDLEAKNQSLIESDVYFVRSLSNVSPSGTSRDAEEIFKVKARANVCWYPPGVFLVVFDRPSMSPSLGRKISLAARHPQYFDDRPLVSSSGARPSSGIGTDWQDHAPSATHVASLIPYMMVTMNEEGQVVQCSDSWHHFTGLSKEESLDSGWVSAIHPGDVVMMASGWADVIRNKRQEWTYEARYLQASTGNYLWFSIRAQAYKNTSGQVICWYASMMDVNDGVNARREADQRRNSILRLISQTGVLLWGVTRSNRSYIREGGLNWDPPRISEYLRPTADQDNAHLAQDSEMSNRQEHEELVSVVQAILLGHKFKSVVEHAEGERHFRTIFIAEHSTSAAATGDDVTTEAALALTFDITDQFVQSALRLENERLAFDERAASEASAMKSRFLANVSRPPGSFSHS